MKNKTQKVLGLLLAVVFVFTSIFTDAMVRMINAAEENFVTLTKRVSDKLTDDNGVDVILDINVTNKEYTERIATDFDIVLLLDASGSMESHKTQVKDAADAFVDVLQKSKVGDSVQVAVVAFNTSNDTNPAFQYLVGTAEKPFVTLKNTVTVSNFTTHRGTPIADALTLAKTILDSGRKGANKVVVLLSDGEAWTAGGVTENGVHYTDNSHVHRDRNKKAIDAAETLKSANGTNAKIYAINYRSNALSDSQALYYETMLMMSSENSGLTKDLVTNNKSDITDYSVYNDYYFTTSLTEEALKKTFAQVAEKTLEISTIGSETTLTETLPEYFHVDVDSSENPLLKSVTYKLNAESEAIDITALITASYGKNGNLALNLGAPVIAEDGTMSLGNLEEGIYSITYTAKLDEGVTAEMLKEKYGNNLNNLIAVAFDTPAVLSYIRTNEMGEVQTGLDAEEVVAETVEIRSNLAVSQSELFIVSFYINDVNVKNQLVMKGGNATAPEIVTPEGNYVITTWDTDFTNVQDNLTVKAYYTKAKHTVTFYVDGEQVDQKTVEDGGSASFPTVKIPENVDNASETKTYTLEWDKTEADLTNISEDIDVIGTIKEEQNTKSYEVIINYVDEEGNTVATAYSDKVKVGETVKVESPEVDGFTAETTVVEFTMPAEKVVKDVVYTADIIPTPDEIPDDPTPKEEPEDPTPTPEEEEIVEDPEIPQEEPEDPTPTPEEPTPTPEEEEIEDPEIPQEEPTVPQTGEKETVIVVATMIPLALALVALLNRKKR